MKCYRYRSSDKAVKIWDAGSRQCVHTFYEHLDQVSCGTAVIVVGGGGGGGGGGVGGGVGGGDGGGGVVHFKGFRPEWCISTIYHA